MKLTRSVLSVCLMVCLMFIAQTAAAEIRAGAVTLSPSIGGYVFEGNEDIENDFSFGLGLGYHFDKNWAAEAVFNYVDSEFDRGGRDLDAYLYHVDALYHFMPGERLVPYVAAGVGGIIINPQVTKSDHDVAANYGGGVKYFLTENVALRADVRHVIAFDETRNNLLYTAGVSFLFGGEKAKKAPVEAPKKVAEKVVIKAEEPKIEKKVIVAAAEQKYIVLVFEDIHFDFDSAALKPEAKTLLKKNIQLLKDNPKTKIRISGFTSASGSPAYNQKLSEKRSKAVQEYLINEGAITRDRLTPIGYGEARPAMHESTPTDINSKEAKANMRVLFEIIVAE
ncbi:MAG: OmpA family protein [Pseudomonadota bacterium]